MKKGPNWPVEKVRIDHWQGPNWPMKKAELTKKKKKLDEVRIDHYKKVRIDQWPGSELTKGQGPNWLGPNKIGSELTRADLAKVRIVLLPFFPKLTHQMSYLIH